MFPSVKTRWPSQYDSLLHKILDKCVHIMYLEENLEYFCNAPKGIKTSWS